jgi:DNA-binding transcriptional ArsR family regulator
MTASDDETADLDFRQADSDADVPPPDDLFRALASSERRRLLSVLSSESPLTLGELTDILVGWERTSDGPAGPDERAKVKIELVHAHLPLLSDAGLIAVEDETVRRVSIAEPVEEAISFATEYEEVTTSGVQ